MGVPGCLGQRAPAEPSPETSSPATAYWDHCFPLVPGPPRPGRGQEMGVVCQGSRRVSHSMWSMIVFCGTADSFMSSCIYVGTGQLDNLKEANAMNSPPQAKYHSHWFGQSSSWYEDYISMYIFLIQPKVKRFYSWFSLNYIKMWTYSHTTKYKNYIEDIHFKGIWRI